MIYVAVFCQEQIEKECITDHGDFGHGTGAYCVKSYPKGEWREFYIEKEDSRGIVRAYVGEFITDYIKEKKNGDYVRNT